MEFYTQQEVAKSTLPFDLIPHDKLAADLGITPKQLDWLRYRKKIRGYKVMGKYKYSQAQISDYLNGVEVNKEAACEKPDTSSSESKPLPTGTSPGQRIVNLSAAQRGRQIARKLTSSMRTSS